MCDIFFEKGGMWDNWHKASKKASKQYGVPISVIMATMWQESRFQAKAKPARNKLLGFIPWKRKSSAYGYAQVKKGTWKEYRRNSGNGGSRDKFKDAALFVAWYHAETNKRNKVAKTDIYNLYLAYHEGRGGFSRKSYNKKPWLIKVAKKVQAKEKEFAKQYASCSKKLNRPWWLPF